MAVCIKCFGGGTIGCTSHSGAKCKTCNGTGRITCTVCGGSGKTPSSSLMGAAPFFTRGGTPGPTVIYTVI